MQRADGIPTRYSSPQYAFPSPILPPIRPTSTIHTPLRLLTNILPAKLALDLFLHNIIPTPPTIAQRNDPQRNRNSHKSHYLVEEVSVR